jgi:hypothetical protein
MEAADAFQASLTTAKLSGIVNQTIITSINELANKLRG